MQVFLYEFVTGGGLYWLDQPAGMAPSLLREGRAMITALARDFARLPDTRLIALCDSRLEPPDLPRCKQQPVHGPDEELQWLGRIASQSDWTVVIAPEFDRMLLDRCQLVESSGGRLLSPGSRFTTWASDKVETTRRWKTVGVPVPQACLLDRGQSPPDDFAFPAVLKPPHGAGSIAVRRVEHPGDLDRAQWPAERMRLETFCPGIPCSVGIIGGRGRHVFLPPCRQILSDDGRFTYQGGQLLWEAELRQRAERLAWRAARIMDDLLGYAGMDLILGPAPDGSQDKAMEVNPRLTTSYVGLRHAVRENLARLMLDLAQGKSVQLTPIPIRIRFDAEGRVSPA